MDKSTVKSFMWFLAFTLVLNVVVRPTAKNLNVPLLKDI